MAKRTHLTESQVERALVCYVQQSLSVAAFANLLGLSKSSALEILNGRTWKQVPRPPAFVGPWNRKEPTVANSLRPSHRYLNQKKVEEGLALYVKHNWTAETLSCFLGTRSFKHLKSILEGYVFKNAQRPANLVWRTNHDRLQEKIEQGLIDFAQHQDLNRLSSFLSLDLNQTLRIVQGKTYTHIPRPPEFPKIHFTIDPSKPIRCIIEEVTKAFSVTPEQLYRAEDLSGQLARQIAIYLARQLLSLSFNELKVQFQVSHHRSIQKSFAAATKKIHKSLALAEKVSSLEEKLKEKLATN